MLVCLVGWFGFSILILLFFCFWLFFWGEAIDQSIERATSHQEVLGSTLIVATNWVSLSTMRGVRPAETEVMVSPFHPCAASHENVVRRQLSVRHELAYLMSMGAKKQ